MTKNYRQCVNTMCKKFINVCQAYPCINTSLHTGRPLKSADRSDGLTYKKSQPGRKALPLCSQLGTVNTGPMGPTDYSWVPVRTYPNPVPGQTEPGDLVLRGGALQSITGGQGASGQGCHHGSSTLHRQFHIPDLPSGEEGGRTTAGDKPQGPQQLCEIGALQNGGPPCLARLNPAGGLDDQAGPKGCIPPGPNSQRLPTPPPVLMGAEVIPVCVSPIWVDISPTGVHKDIETSSGDVETDGYSSDHIPRRYTDHAPLKGGAITDHSPGVSDVRSLKADSQQGKISAHSEAGIRVPGVPGELNLPIPGPPLREDEEDSTECPHPSGSTAGVHKRHSKICGEGLSLNKSYLAGSTPLQSPAVHDKLSGPNRPTLYNQDDQIQCKIESHRGSQDGLVLVDFLESGCHDGVSPLAPYPRLNDRIRCIQHRLGSMPRGNSNRRDVVKEGVIEPHQLPGAASSLPSTPVLCETQEQYHRSVEDGQRNSGDLYKQNGGNSLTSPVQPGYFLVGLEPATEHISVRRAPAREGEHSGRPGVKGDERQMRLDVKPSCFQSNPISDGSMRNRHIRFTPDETASKVFQLEARPRGGGDRCFQPRLVSCEGLCQSTMVPDSSLPLTDKTQMARLVVITPLWNTQPWFPTILSLLEDYPRLLPTRTDLVILPTGQEFIMKQGVPELIAWPISGNPLHHKEFLHRLQTSSCPPGGLRPSRTTTHCLPNGQIGVSNGTGIPLLDL